jgi:hypothetical protein
MLSVKSLLRKRSSFISIPSYLTCYSSQILKVSSIDPPRMYSGASLIQKYELKIEW